MATLKKYSDESGYYVQHTFCAKGRLFHVTYQIKDAALRKLESKGFRAGSNIPKLLFYELLDTEGFFTGSSGATGEEVEDRERQDGEDPFTKLSDESRKWIVLRILEHPNVRSLVKPIDSATCEGEVEYEQVPPGFFEQLVAVAQRIDGTDFIKNLDRSYGGPQSLRTSTLMTQREFRLKNKLSNSEAKRQYNAYLRENGAIK